MSVFGADSKTSAAYTSTSDQAQSNSGLVNQLIQGGSKGAIGGGYQEAGAVSVKGSVNTGTKLDKDAKIIATGGVDLSKVSVGKNGTLQLTFNNTTTNNTTTPNGITYTPPTTPPVETPLPGTTPPATTPAATTSSLWDKVKGFFTKDDGSGKGTTLWNVPHIAIVVVAVVGLFALWKWARS